jgi:hypothetical protein
MSRITPFKSKIDKIFWFKDNCDRCNRASCYAKKCLNRSNTITKRQAKWIGYNGTLDSKCSYFGVENDSLYTNELTDNFIYNMF